MKKMFNKVLFLSAAVLLSNNLLAQETICFKNGLEKPSLIETTPLDGEVCKGIQTLEDMKNSGWQVLDIKLQPVGNKFNYSYYFYKDDNKKSSVTPQKNVNQQLSLSKGEFSIKPIGAKVTNINNNKSNIDIGNLIVGQSGIVVHIYDNDKRLIVSNAKVISSNENSSVVEFFPFNDLTQDAIPTSNRSVTENDILILNYMYNSSLLIAPTLDSFQAVRENFKLNNFMHSDIFAAKLKVENKPYPTKEDIQKFAIEQNLGTIFFVLDNKVYVLDTKTFTILESYAFAYESAEKQMPFYTRVEDIEESIFNSSFFDFFSEDKKSNYDEYYKRILGLK
ncbi:plasminogen-binding N-terminal domain-containing protein [Arcobacter aquimarinus]|uniref:plasminogen-binding N-terminal domain-containing protein n=1 Tax=Arcobacter aquimarinus TaxID=1315211 RepID=UPI002A0BD7ED|nr:plasminogen-binding N-terminal domain-containing protein [Arcobacter sp.]